ncbi:uncharacterized protein LACBIDRAFT_330560 [Laccaria bicolor S238N-H82]|uniref:Predicted protein n=1 Tax=Laccaria bicolor (strain S238N-H82 / ATCC MYA-4686) TaxID=486041 RepID=B0DLQ3_LACBS|nr:uncharacterized protein LACBIDRAFT_330560 [Laccaria bicolor S238N-H82]EDR04336.1 predicted protein [Laccaria bicolor S238N-H82]|eukprot:XP_001884855.1 predicted protein [Laccaria bicolor S238N-H82]
MNLAETTVGPILLGIFGEEFLAEVFNDTLWISVSLMYLAWAYTMQDTRRIPMYLLKPFWPYISSAFVTTVTACLTQIYLADRILRIKKSVRLYILVLILSACAFIAGIVFAVKACLSRMYGCSKYSGYPLTPPWRWITRTGSQRSDKVIKRLMQTTIQSVLFVAYQEAQYCSIFGISIGRLYTNTLMDTLRCRKKLREMLTFPGDSMDLMTKRGNKSFELYVRKEILTDVHVDDLDLSPPKPLDALNSETASRNDTELEPTLNCTLAAAATAKPRW